MKILLGALSFLVFEQCTSFIVTPAFSNVNHCVEKDFLRPNASFQTTKMRPSSSSQLFSTSSETDAPKVPAPTFDGKLIFPMRALTIGLKDHTVAAVYAIMNKGYKRGQDSWTNCEFIGVTRDLDSTLKALVEEHGSEKVAHGRVISYPYPQKVAMEELANKWVAMSKEAGGSADMALIESEGWETASNEVAAEADTVSRFFIFIVDFMNYVRNSCI